MSDDYYQRVIEHHGYQPRAEQAELFRQLRAVAQSEEPARAIVQAGTGTGKTLAVLVAGAEVGQPGRPALVLIVTNNLARQYTGRDARAVTAATGALVARVVGSTWYVCASSQAGREVGLPQDADPDDPSDGDDYDPHGDYDRDSNFGMRKRRDAWLEEQTTDGGWATQWERQAHHDDTFTCPGYPMCEGRLIGGCGKRYARKRGRTEAHIVISNYHLAAVQTFLPKLELLPEPAMTIVDEAHALPDTVCDILSARIGPGFGRVQSDVVDEMLTSQESKSMGALFDWVQATRKAVIARVPWRPDDRWHTEQRVTLLSPELAEQIGKAVDVYSGIRRSEDPDAAEASLADGLSTEGVLRMIVQSATEPAIVPVVHRPPADPDERAPLDALPDHVYLHRADAAEFIAEMLGERAALVSGTVPTTLPARCGMPELVATDVGHPFDYATQVRGWISRYDGAKSYNRSHNRDTRARLFDHRVRQLARFIGTEPALVLCPSHADVAQIARALPAHMAHAQVFTQPRYGGSEAAMREVAEFSTASGPRVLIGVDSLATGLDLPGDLLTRVAWWSLPLGRASVLDQQRQRMHPGTGAQLGTAPRFGSYLDNRLRVKVAQGVGRLIRTSADRGEVLLCDRRFRDHMKGSTTLLDAHLRQIPWDWAPE